MVKKTGTEPLGSLLSKLPEHIPAMIIVYNVNTGKYVYVSGAVKKLLGYPPEKVFNGGLDFVSSLIHPDDMAEITKKNQEALDRVNSKRSQRSDDSPILSFEYRMKHKNGDWIWLLTEGTVYDRTPDGLVNHVINISIDITERKSGEDYLRHTTQELKALNQTKDEFITIASHQLRTPATAIKQYLGLLLGGYSDPLTQDQRNFIEKAYESNMRQLTIVEDILRTAQLDAQKLRLRFEPVSIKEIIDTAVKSLNTLLTNKKQRLTLEIPKDKLLVRADRGHFLMVIENFLENASKYSEEGKQIKISVKSKAAQVEISVKDAGVGIAKADLPRLFQKFSRISNPLTIEAGGSGLGLYWADKIIKMHDGSVRVTSVPDKGTEFTITLPKA